MMQNIWKASIVICVFIFNKTTLVYTSVSIMYIFVPQGYNLTSLDLFHGTKANLCKSHGWGNSSWSNRME